MSVSKVSLDFCFILLLQSNICPSGVIIAIRMLKWTIPDYRQYNIECWFLKVNTEEKL